MIFLVAIGVADDEGSEASPPQAPPRHRIDFGLQSFDAAEGDSVTGSLDYSWVPLDHHSFAVSVLLVGSDLSRESQVGLALRFEVGVLDQLHPLSVPRLPAGR